jgi:hypothetical protein
MSSLTHVQPILYAWRKKKAEFQNPAKTLLAGFFGFAVVTIIPRLSPLFVMVHLLVVLAFHAVILFCQQCFYLSLSIRINFVIIGLPEHTFLFLFTWLLLHAALASFTGRETDVWRCQCCIVSVLCGVLKLLTALFCRRKYDLPVPMLSAPRSRLLLPISPIPIASVARVVVSGASYAI